MSAITIDRAVVEQALEFLEAEFGWSPGEAPRIDALRAALARQDEPVEPVAYTTGHCENHKQKGGCQLHNLQCGWPDCDRKPTTAPPQQAEPVEEPAYKVKVAGRWHEAEPLAPAFSLPDGEHLLYTAPPQRKLVPLTEAEIEHIGITHQSLRQVARAVERAVWEKNHG